MGAPPPAKPVRRTYRDARRLTRVLRGLLVALAVISAVTAAAKLSHFSVLQAMVDNDVEALVSFPGIVTLLISAMNTAEFARAIVFSATVVLFAIWIHRMQSNTFALGIMDLQYTPAWAVGWNFVPIANLWIPYQVMREIWCANRNPTGWQFDKPSRFLVVWWLLWLGSIVYVHFWRDSGSAQDVLLREIFDAKVACVRAAFGALSAIASLMLVTLLHRHQVRAASQSLAQVFE
jgi:hypothetical protein